MIFNNFRYILKSSLFAASLLSIAIILLLPGCSRKQYRQEQGIIWNTTYSITYESDKDIHDSVALVLDEVTRSLSVFDSTSLVCRVNMADSVPVDRHFKNCYDISRRVNELSGGIYDPTLTPLITAWGFGKGHKVTADTLRIDSLLAICGIAKTRIDDGRMIKDDPRISFNFSSVAKGYGCDMVGEMMRRNGIENFLVEIGGEIMAGGHRPDGGPWIISVDKPEGDDNKIIHDSQCLIALSNSGLATSGNYRNYHKEGAERFGHIISPITGRPARTDILSSTVAARTAAEADALATALMAMGSDNAIKLVTRRSLPAMLVLADSSVWMSPTFKTLIKTGSGK